ncbi:MAG: hypothetical protein Q8L53_01315 [Aestuariivirga sp.]|nr:hypothetical protein [Aestuariivirga sp.]
MNRRFWLAVATYVLPTFPLGFFWHLSTFAENYRQLAIYREDVVVPMGLGSMVIQGLIFAWIYPRLFSTAKGQWLSSALRFGLIFGTLAWSFLVLPVAAKYNMTSVSSFMILETGFTILQFAVVSPLIALAYRETAQS